MIKVAFAGPQDSGKTTMAMAMASIFGAKDYITAYVPEYARDYIRRFGAPSNLAEQLYITRRQIEFEGDIAPGTQLLFTDSPVFLSYLYGLDAATATPKGLFYLAKIYRAVMGALDYQAVFYLEPVHKVPRDDGVRVRCSRRENDIYAAMLKGFLAEHRLNSHFVQSIDYMARVARVKSIIEDYLKYGGGPTE